ncbi:MraY family glycosyltransferase [Anaerorhabdus sp.]|jgi:UDP-GlcNAc:undecaprenyl-phosphate/decaprenyl-phosphate GlcNAc-1-phosphate transferase|uniref:MraY family glycosyltransferase n=1 Tax=Anaerorhabdus sp. TaxID=1872524 RepID=UPI002FC77E93
MNLVIGAFPYFVLPLILSLVLVPIAKKVGIGLGIYAEENQRTVHHGKMVRMGGLAIYVAFMVGMAIFVKADDTLNGILLGGMVVFFGGLLDDIFDLKPIIKLAFQIVAALIAIFMGQVYLSSINLPFGITINSVFISGFISFVWIVGITNAINLMDGLDGLSSGISLIVTCTIGILGFFMGRRDICIMSLILAGAILGFLKYNFHPASIFMGDCGALFLGYMIATISLLGFKTTAFITLGFPILILFIPISDTIIAIIRRKLKGQKISEADRSHLHHVLMYKLDLGHRNAVLILYLMTMLFGMSSIVTYFDKTVGIVMVIVLLFISEIFIEKTGMINPKFHPLLGLWRRIRGKTKEEDKH